MVFRAQWVIHLEMTGQLFSERAASIRLLSATARAALAPEEQARFRPDSHTHLHFVFEDGGDAVYFRDVRKFGKLLLLAPEHQRRVLLREIDASERALRAAVGEPDWQKQRDLSPPTSTNRPP